MLRLLITAIILTLASVNAGSSSAASPAVEILADDICGIWLKDDGAFKVKIERIADKYYGKLMWLEQPLGKDGKPKRDELNPDPSLRSRPFIGLPVLTSLEYDGDGEWNDGDIYDVESGKTYSCKVMMESKNRAEVRAFMGFSFLGKSFFFDRVTQ